ncbi:MAG: hypothetical protein B6229_08830 [Spirochaetaceae bacterium 4572_7]|nr:MAG: hypothetical protein B6229_08830 [Spirochaetaceae bacterium 4572_7]
MNSGISIQKIEVIRYTSIMKKIYLKERTILFLFFISIIVLGTILLALPWSWDNGKARFFGIMGKLDF